MPKLLVRTLAAAIPLFLLISPVSAQVVALDVEVDLAPAPEHEGGYRCSAVIRDAESGEALSAPTIVFVHGEEATVTSGLPDGGIVRLTVFVTDDDSEARYSAEVLRDDRVVSSQRATIKF